MNYAVNGQKIGTLCKKLQVSIMFEKLTKKSHFLNFASEASYVYIFIEKVSKKSLKIEIETFFDDF